MRNAYPVIFTITDNQVLVEVPDFQILTEGTDISDAIEMARDAIGLAGITREDMEQSIPNPSDVSEINPTTGTFSQDGKSFLSLVNVDFSEYRKQVDNRMVRRNVTLPNWLNQKADKAKINVSKVLQDALIAKLQ